MIGMFPLLFLVIIVYTIIAYGGGAIFGGGEKAFEMMQFLDKPVMKLQMHENVEWALTRGDVFMLLALVLLFVELIGATRSDKRTIVNHGLSMAVFTIALLAFVLAEPYATSTFFFLMVFTLIDVVAGFIITIRVARRDIGFGGDIPGL